MKLCIDCKWCQKGFHAPFCGNVPSKCKHPNAASPVNGAATIECEILRSEKGLCGVEPEWFEQKDYKAELEEAKAKIEELEAKSRNNGIVMYQPPEKSHSWFWPFA